MTPRSLLLTLLLAAALPLVAATPAPTPNDIRHATLDDKDKTAPEISTAELQTILDDHSANVFDARPALEFATSHIPGALNVAPRAGVPMSEYVSDVAEIGRILHDKTAPIVLYCNGPYCGKSKRLAAELIAAGYTNIRRYQLGIPIWRALGGVTAIEFQGLHHVLRNDSTAVVIDTREARDFEHGSLPHARNLPRSLVLEGKDVGEVKQAKDDGRLPMEDHNTRIVVVDADAARAKFVAEALVKEAFHNVSYFPRTFGEAMAAAAP